MSRKNVVHAFPLINAGDMSSSITSSAMNTKYQDNVGLNIVWSGTSPVGAITVEVRNAYSGVSGGWTALDFGTSIAITGNSGTHALNVHQTPYEELRVNYVRTSGTGTLYVTASAKTVGA